MAKTDAEFHALMQRVIAGSERAAEELFRDYEPYLLQVIRKRLSKQLRVKFDSLDFAQDVWASFFARESGERIFRTPQDFVAFLAKLAQNKVVDVRRKRMRAQKYDVTREQSIDDSHRFDKRTLIGPEPTPSQVVSKEDEWTAFLRRQPLVYRRIYVLLREGRTQAEIAEELGLNVRTVNRVVDRLAPGGLP